MTSQAIMIPGADTSGNSAYLLFSGISEQKRIENHYSRFNINQTNWHFFLKSDMCTRRQSSCFSHLSYFCDVFLWSKGKTFTQKCTIRGKLHTKRHTLQESGYKNVHIRGNCIQKWMIVSRKIDVHFYLLVFKTSINSCRSEMEKTSAWGRKEKQLDSEEKIFVLSERGIINKK